MQRLLLGLSFVSAGCFYPADRGRALEARMEKLSTSNEELESALRRHEQKVLVRVEEKMAELKKTLAGLDRTARQSNADEGVLLQKAVEELAMLKGQLETWQHKFTEMEARLATLESETQKRLAEFSQKAQEAAEAQKKAAEEAARPANKKDFLALAVEKAKAGDVAMARKLFGEFLEKWEKDELAGEAHFGLGETFFSEDKCREALFEYGKVIQEFPKSRSAPVAYLRSSTCFKTLKMSDESVLALEELVRLYPKSDSAKTARAELAKIKKSKGKK